MRLFYKCLDTVDYDTAASLFADDAVYLRAPLTPDETESGADGPAAIHGLTAIKTFWSSRTGRTTTHVIRTESVTGCEWFAEGSVAVDGALPRPFLTHVTFDDAGKIQRYLARR